MHVSFVHRVEVVVAFADLLVDLSQRAEDDPAVVDNNYSP